MYGVSGMCACVCGGEGKGRLVRSHLADWVIWVIHHLASFVDVQGDKFLKMRARYSVDFQLKVEYVQFPHTQKVKKEQTLFVAKSLMSVMCRDSSTHSCPAVRSRLRMVMQT